MDRQNRAILQRGFTAGTRAIDNYDRCCTLFGFDPARRGSFGRQQMLYAKNATPEGYSVWMLAHTSLNESFNRDRKWYNMFGTDTIKEIWFDTNDAVGSLQDRSVRICFAKQNGNYVFQGLYEPKTIAIETVPDGECELVRTFQRISLCYPMDDTAATPTRIEVFVNAPTPTERDGENAERQTANRRDFSAEHSTILHRRVAYIGANNNVKKGEVIDCYTRSGIFYVDVRFDDGRVYTKMDYDDVRNKGILRFLGRKQ